MDGVSIDLFENELRRLQKLDVTEKVDTGDNKLPINNDDDLMRGNENEGNQIELSLPKMIQKSYTEEKKITNSKTNDALKDKHRIFDETMIAVKDLLFHLYR